MTGLIAAIGIVFIFPIGLIAMENEDEKRITLKSFLSGLLFIVFGLALIFIDIFIYFNSGK